MAMTVMILTMARMMGSEDGSFKGGGGGDIVYVKMYLIQIQGHFDSELGSVSVTPYFSLHLLSWTNHNQ
eukprot:1127414-Karenia_brevis.AAC.1